jgi:LytS/YehU family sensor histidine kinase
MVGGLVLAAALNLIDNLFFKVIKEDDLGKNLLLMLVFNAIAFSARFMHQGILHTFKVQQLRAEQMEGELKHLRSQVNPHFLFNTLNNLYATNLEDPEKANEIILQLADLMRYQLHSAQQQRVSLAEEVQMLENYISLEKIRIHNVIVTVEKEGDFREVTLAPLLLLPLVENAFKHGTGLEASRIHFQFVLKDGTFEFNCVNTLPATRRKVHSGWVGLANVRKRLGLLYPDNHRFTAQKAEETFVTNVTITV